MEATIDIKLIKREDREGNPEVAEFFDSLEHKGYGFAQKDAKTWWGARAIWQNSGYPFDILHDRQNCGGLEEDRKELVKWLNESGLDLLHGAFLQHVFRTKTLDYLLVRDGKFAILGSPNGSFGYAYIGAWIEDEE